MVNRFSFKFLYLFSFLTLFLFSTSCVETGGLASSQVVVAMYPWGQLGPYLNYKGDLSVACRKGRPDDYLTPWDERRLIQGEPTRTTEVDEGGGGERESKADVIYIDGGTSDYWFWFAPLIQNDSTWHLVVTEIRVRVFQGRDEVGSETFSDGYCGTPLLYHLEPGEQINIGHLNQLYHKGNLKLFVDGLEPKSNQNQNSAAAFPQIRLSEYRVEWQMIGFFADVEGNQQGVFQKTGNFPVRTRGF